MRIPRTLGLAVVLATGLAETAWSQSPSVGLSTVRSQRFFNENLLGFYTPQAGDLFGAVLATGDFNGDGADDLATAMPFDDGLVGEPIVDSGTVIVRYGIPGSGLATSLASAVLRQVPFMDPPESRDRFGGALASCDFNGDGFDDLAVGVSEEDHVGRVDAGAVQLHYGGTSGLNFKPEGFFAQSSPGIPGDAEDGDRFGAALACGDFDADGFDDLAVGAPGEDQEGLLTEFGAGMVVLVPGSVIGLRTELATYLTQDVDGVGGDAEFSDFFSFALAVGDFNRDGFDDLVVGSPGEDEARGALHVFFGTVDGITPAASLFWMETFLGGSQAEDDFFGGEFAVADFDGDGFDDLAVGIRDDDLDGAAVDAGRVAALYGGRLGFDRGRTQFWSEDDILGPAASEPGDRFGMELAAGDFDRDGFAELVIGHPNEALTGPSNGAATVLVGSAAGLTDARTREIALGLEGFPNPAPGSLEGRDFAAALAAGDFDGDGHADLALGAPREGGSAVGGEMVLYGALFADGVDNGDASFWSQVHSTSAVNRVSVVKEARLPDAPSTPGRFGLEFLIAGADPRTMPAPSFVRVGPDRGFHDERTLRGTFFIDPQSLTMSSASGANSFRFLSFEDGATPGSKTRLGFNLVRTGSAYALSADSRNAATDTLQSVGAGMLVPAGGSERLNIRVDFEWRAGTPGHLSIWRTVAAPSVVPDVANRVLIVSADLPNTGGAVINQVTAGAVSGLDQGTFGRLFLDELSFRR
jgi:hypothetical protein